MTKWLGNRAFHASKWAPVKYGNVNIPAVTESFEPIVPAKRKRGRPRKDAAA